MSLGRYIRRLRQQRGLSQRALAEQAGMSQRTLIEIEQGRQRSMTLVPARRVAQALGVSVDMLAAEAEKDEQESKVRLP